MKNWNYLTKQPGNNAKVIARPNKEERPPFKWAGAKNRMFGKYLASGFFTNHEPKIFVDMFAGTGAVGWWIARNYPNTTVVLNETCDLRPLDCIAKGFSPAFAKRLIKLNEDESEKISDEENTKSTASIEASSKLSFPFPVIPFSDNVNSPVI